jgi:hypothetical protein
MQQHKKLKRFTFPEAVSMREMLSCNKIASANWRFGAPARAGNRVPANP